ncbi:unnamed protein product [Wuchereria bancrofti]|uniref:CNH domain-containing protein n=1 Tax=Wuchereria bancrofti TaxID=6293 RepID=A0A3P7EC71_WUCBA|nr:unnamed protein product [Wuchereria bancrofti]
MEEGTLRGPNKPLPPTPTDQSPVSDIPGDDGTLLASHKVNGSVDHRRSNSDSLSRNRQSQMVKAASVPDQTPIAAEIIIGSGSSGSEGSGSSPDASPFDARKSNNRISGAAASGQRCGVMPDLLPRTPIERSTAFLAFTKDGSSPSIDSQSVEEFPSGVNSLPRIQAPLAARDREKSFVAYFGAGMSGSGTVNRPGRAQDTNQVQVNVNPNPAAASNGLHSDGDTPEIRKYKKKFSGDILCAALWGVNLLIGTDSGLMLLDRSGQGKGNYVVYVNRIRNVMLLVFSKSEFVIHTKFDRK